MPKLAHELQEEGMKRVLDILNKGEHKVTDVDVDYEDGRVVIRLELKDPLVHVGGHY